MVGTPNHEKIQYETRASKGDGSNLDSTIILGGNEHPFTAYYSRWPKYHIYQGLFRAKMPLNFRNSWLSSCQSGSQPDLSAIIIMFP